MPINSLSQSGSIPFSVKKEFILKKIESLSPCRQVVDNIDPHDFVIVTFSPLLPSVFRRYDTQGSKKLTLILVDYCDDENEYVKKFSRFAEILPLKALTVSHTRPFLLFARYDIEFWKEFCIIPLLRILEKYNLRKDLYIDIVSTPALFKKNPVKNFISSNIDIITEIYYNLNDQDSKDIYLGIVKGVESGFAGYPTLSNYWQYFHPKVQAQPGDTVVEGGIFDGATTLKFAKHVGENGLVIAFEPEPNYYANCKDIFSDHTNIIIENLGLWSGKTTLNISTEGQKSSVTQAKYTDCQQICSLIDLDSYLSSYSKKCDLIKLDIEGSERQCLLGSLTSLKKFNPKLQISIYHSDEDILMLPSLLMDKCSGYDFWIGHHALWFNESILYAKKKSNDAIQRPHVLSRKVQSNFSPENTIVTAFDNNFVPVFSVMLESLKLNSQSNSNIEIFALTDNVDPYFDELLNIQLKDHSNIKLRTIDCSSIFDCSKQSTSDYTNPAFYRLHLPNILPNKKNVLYLDPDTLICSDLSDIFSISLQDKFAAAVHDVRSVVHLNNKWSTGDDFNNLPLGDYYRNLLGFNESQVCNIFNSGVMFLNLEMMRREGLVGKCISMFNDKKLLWPDQDILNKLFNNNVIYINPKWNFIPYDQKIESQLPNNLRNIHNAAKRNPSVVHFAGSNYKPWSNKNILFFDLFWFYARKSPFYERILIRLLSS